MFNKINYNKMDDLETFCKYKQKDLYLILQRRIKDIILYHCRKHQDIILAKNIIMWEENTIQRKISLKSTELDESGKKIKLKHTNLIGKKVISELKELYKNKFIPLFSIESVKKIKNNVITKIIFYYDENSNFNLDQNWINIYLEDMELELEEYNGIIETFVLN